MLACSLVTRTCFLNWDLTLAHWTQVSDRCTLGYLFCKIQSALTMCFLISLPTIKRVACWPNSVFRLIQPKFILQKVLVNSNILFVFFQVGEHTYEIIIMKLLLNVTFLHSLSTNIEYTTPWITCFLKIGFLHIRHKIRSNVYSMLLKEKTNGNNLSRRKSKKCWKISRACIRVVKTHWTVTMN